ARSSRTSSWRWRERSATLTADTRLTGWSGRCSTVTLPDSGNRPSTPEESELSRAAMRRIGRSDQRGCAWRLSWNDSSSGSASASSTSTTQPMSDSSSGASSQSAAQASVSKLRPAKIEAAAIRSASFGVTTTTFMPCPSDAVIAPHQLAAQVARHAGHDALERHEGFAHVDAVAVHGELADGGLVRAAALLDDRHRFLHRAARLEEAREEHGVGEIAHVHRCAHLPQKPVLGEDHDAADAFLVEEAQQLVQVQVQVIL